ncbi:MAG: hypothetical protein LUH09_02545, partial [Clostridiales bacterium]|nr:hypothetical protein [Clostridiales bacterium]
MSCTTQWANDAFESDAVITRIHQYSVAPVFNWSEDGRSAAATITCEKCGDTQTITATITSEVKTNATETEDGVTIYTATVTIDGTEYTDTKELTDIPATGHSWEDDYTIDKEPTCTEDGSKSIHCSNCNEVTDIQVIPATGHSYGAPVFNWSEDGRSAAATIT